MKIIVKEPNKDLEIREIDELNLETMQNLVGGNIEHIVISESYKIDAWCNEEGKILGLEPNVALLQNRKHLDTIMRTIFFTAFDYEGNTLSLTSNQIDIIKEIYHETPQYMDLRYGTIVPYLDLGV